MRMVYECMLFIGPCRSIGIAKAFVILMTQYPDFRVVKSTSFYFTVGGGRIQHLEVIGIRRLLVCYDKVVVIGCLLTCTW